MLELPDMKTLLPGASGLALLGQIPAPHLPHTVSGYLCSLLSVPLQNFYVSWFEDLVQLHELMNGERPSGGDLAQAWDEGLDEAIEGAVPADLQKFLGHGFFGEHSIDTRVHDPVERTSKAGFWARRTAEAWREHMGEDKFLAAFGIDAAALAATPVSASEPAKTVDGQPAVATLEQVLQMIRFAAYDTVIDAMPEIEEMADSDDGLALSAVMRTKFPDQSLVPVDAAMMLVRGVRELAKTMGQGYNEKLYALSQAAPSAPVAAVEAPQPTAEPVKARRGRKGAKAPQAAAPPSSNPTPAPEAAADLPPLPPPLPLDLPPIAAPPSGNAIVAAINALKSHSGSSEREIAEVIGISRSALNNIANGKAEPDLTHAQAGGLRLLAERHRDALTSAIAGLGGA